MKLNKILFLMLLVAVLSLTSCMREGGANTFPGDLVILKYSELLNITQCDGYTVVEIKNPWSKDSTAILHSYVLIPRDSSLANNTVGHPTPLRGKGQGMETLYTPLKKAVVYSSVHASLLNEIGALKDIRGVCDAKFMYLDKIHQGIKAGTIADCGEGMTPNIEKIMDIQPDAILLSPFENSGTYGKLGKIGIPLVECADYMETNPLGRAEWMRFYGMLFGCEQQADSLFAVVESNYNELAAAVNSKDSLNPKNSSYSPTVFTEKKTGSTWYVAGGKSYVARLVSDAGGDYIFNKENGAGSQPFNPEKVFDKAQKADLWLMKYSQATPLTLKQISKEWGAYKSLKAFKSGNVWGCNLTTSMFYEETPFHPDLLLKDLVKIFHPYLLKDYHPRYYQKIE